MAWNRRWLGVGVLALSGWVLTGCASELPPWAVPGRSLAEDITAPAPPAKYRFQAPDGPPVTLQRPLIPPPPPGFGVTETPTLPSLSNGPIQQTSLASRGTVRVRVRAWVNGLPIFDDEVLQIAAPDLRSLGGLSESQRSEKMTELFNMALEQLIDQEVMYQDAVKKLKKVSPQSLDKMREFVDQEYDKWLQAVRKANAPEEEIRAIEPARRRILERQLISTEYARSRIKPVIESVINLSLIADYYENHKNEFQTFDRVVWQNVFIPVNPLQPTVEDARRFAEELINGLKRPEEFPQLMVYDRGDSKLRGGEGQGQRRGKKDETGQWIGEIRPAELEEYLFNLKEGEIGPVVAFATGVHLFRVTKREYAGQLPLDDQVSKIIRKKLEGQLADREYRRIVRELRSRSVVRLESAGP